jgi:hypothetical protein
LSAFNDLTGNSGRNPWGIGCARIDMATMRLFAPSAKPIIAAGMIPGRDIAFVADPFWAAAHDAAYVFAEAWSQSEQHGQIAAFRLDSRRQVAESGIALGEPFHLSYPCVFKHGDQHYMLPEAWESGQLVLYKARRFPWEWERAKVLLELDYADPQIFFHAGIWYIFLNTDPLTNASASVFYADSLLGDWSPHPRNPILDDDPLRARSAGSLVRYGGQIFRFSQDCRRRYGQGVFATEIVELSPSTIITRPIGQVELERPKWAQHAFHHLDVFIDGGVHYALFDGYTGAFDPQSQ